MKGRLIRAIIAFGSDGLPMAVDTIYGRVGVVDFGDGPQETTEQKNVSLAASELSSQTTKLLQSLSEALAADAGARAKKDAVIAQQAAADQLKAAKKEAADARARVDAADKDVAAAGG